MKITTVKWILTSILVWSGAHRIYRQFFMVWQNRKRQTHQKKIESLNSHLIFINTMVWIRDQMRNSKWSLFFFLASKRLLPLHRFWRKWVRHLRLRHKFAHCKFFHTRTKWFFLWGGQLEMCAIDSCGLITPGHIRKRLKLLF